MSERWMSCATWCRIFRWSSPRQKTNCRSRRVPPRRWLQIGRPGWKQGKKGYAGSKMKKINRWRILLQGKDISDIFFLSSESMMFWKWSCSCIWNPNVVDTIVLFPPPTLVTHILRARWWIIKIKSIYNIGFIILFTFKNRFDC